MEGSSDNLPVPSNSAPPIQESLSQDDRSSRNSVSQRPNSRESQSDPEANSPAVQEEGQAPSRQVGDIEMELAPPSPIPLSEDAARTFDQSCLDLNDLILSIRERRENIFNHVIVHEAATCLNYDLGCDFKATNRMDYERHMQNCDYNPFAYCREPECKVRARDNPRSLIFDEFEQTVEHQVREHGIEIVTSNEVEVLVQVTKQPPQIFFVRTFNVKTEDLCETSVALYLRITRNGKIIPFAIAHGESDLNPTELKLSVQAIPNSSYPSSSLNQEPKCLPLYEFRPHVNEEHKLIDNDHLDTIFMLPAYPTLHAIIENGLMQLHGRVREFPYFKISDAAEQGQRLQLKIAVNVQTTNFATTDEDVVDAIRTFGYLTSWRSLIPRLYRTEALAVAAAGTTGLHPDLENCFNNMRMPLGPLGTTRAVTTLTSKLEHDLIIYSNEDGQHGQEVLRAVLIKEAVSRFYSKTFGTGRRRRFNHVHPRIVITTDLAGSAALIQHRIKTWFPFLGVYCLNDVMTSEQTYEAMLEEPDVLIITSTDLDTYWRDNATRDNHLFDRIKMRNSVSLYVHLKIDRYSSYFIENNKNLLKDNRMRWSRHIFIARSDVEPFMNSDAKVMPVMCGGSTIHQRVAKLEEFVHFEVTENADWDRIKSTWFNSNSYHMKRVVLIAQSETAFGDLERCVANAPVQYNILQFRMQIEDQRIRYGINQHYLARESFILISMYFGVGNLDFREIDSVFVYGINCNFAEFIRQADLPTKRLVVITSEKAKDESNNKFVEFKKNVFTLREMISNR